MSQNTERFATMPRPVVGGQAQSDARINNSVRAFVNEKPILIFSGLAILWSAFFLLN